MENKTTHSCCDLPKKNNSVLSAYYPLLIVFALIVLLSIAGIVITQDTSPMFVMQLFSAFFFIIFGFLKIIRWSSFAKMFSSYDPLASKVVAYAYVYPLIELGIGYCYWRGMFMFEACVLTIATLSITNIGIAKALSRKQVMSCACIGTLFKIPLSRLTIAENSLMILMALWMLLKLI